MDGKKRYNTQGTKQGKPRKRLLSLFEEYLLVLVRRGFDTEVLPSPMLHVTCFSNMGQSTLQVLFTFAGMAIS